jgi:hypothetical protein
VPQGSHAATIDDDGDDRDGGDGDRERTVPDRISLRLPADGRYSRVARVAVSAVAVRLGLGPRVIEDLRIALDEALILLLRRVSPIGDDAAGADGTLPHLHLVFEAGDDSMAIEVGLDPRPHPSDADRSAQRDDLDALHRFEELLPPRIVARRVAPAEGVVVLALR